MDAEKKIRQSCKCEKETYVDRIELQVGHERLSAKESSETEGTTPWDDHLKNNSINRTTG